MEKSLQYPVFNEAILASAGTGKTFTLAMRFLSLLHQGVKPSSILASTFTNKAAGEIFDKLIEELRDLAENEEKIASLVTSGLLPSTFTKASAVTLLRMLLQGKEELKISTLDSFFLNIIRAFPLECGIHGEITLLEEEDNTLRDQALLQWIRKATREERALLREMVKNASFGAENKSLYKILQQLIRNLYSQFLLAPEKELYGGYNRILSAMLPIEDILKEEKITELTENFTERFLEAAPALAKDKKFPSYIEGFVSDVRNLTVQHTLSEAGENFWDYLLRGNESLFDRSPAPEEISFTYNRKEATVSGSCLRDLLLLMRHVRALLLYRCLERTKSIYNILESFHKELTLIGRSRGKITFGDIPYILRPDEKTDLALPFSESAGIEERLDAAIDHYLLDEFQDTSDAQYRAMERLLDEVISDPSFRRSFFYVGDIKQSIYQWREGNPGLFEMIYRKYLPYGERSIKKKTLSLSYRSGESVLNAVNAVFAPPYQVSDHLTLKAMEMMQFSRHLPSSSAGKQKGTSILFEIPSDPGTEGKNKAKALYMLLQQIDPFRRERPLTVGILFRKNSSAKECADFFRDFYAEDLAKGKKDLPPLYISMDGKLPAVESPLFSLYNTLVLLASHPGDPYAKGHLDLLRFGEEPLPPELLLKRLKFIREDEPMPEEPLGLLASGIRNDWDKGSYALFLERFLAAFRDEAREFDLTRMEAVRLATSQLMMSEKNLSPDAYREMLETASAPNTSLRGTIQMMTIHKSKGLDFDIVLMPELNPGKRNRNPLIPHVAKDESFHTRYITFFPGSSYAATFPLFREELEKEALSDAYEDCCNLYVGMTRARYALYLFTDEKSKSTSSYQQREILTETFGVRGEDPAFFPREGMIPPPYENAPAPIVISYLGDPLWYQKLEKEKEKKSKGLTEEAGKLAEMCLEKYEAGKVRILSAPPPVEFITPSSFHDKKNVREGKISSSAILTFQQGGNTALGTRIHKILEAFPYSGMMKREEFFQRVLTAEEKNDPGITSLLEGFFREDSPLYKALLPPENGFTEIWREKDFLLAGKEEGRIFSGTFDRVHIVREEKGFSAPIKEVVVFDFKSDHLKKGEELLNAYSAQMLLYIAALEKMLSLPKGKVKAVILALYPGLALEVKGS